MTVELTDDEKHLALSAAALIGVARDEGLLTGPYKVNLDSVLAELAGRPLPEKDVVVEHAIGIMGVSGFAEGEEEKVRTLLRDAVWSLLLLRQAW